MKLKYLWPDIYSNLLPKDILEIDLHEKKATCDQCIKAPPKYKKSDFYENHLKCCTFQPYLPNYVVGGVLADHTGRYDRIQKIFRKMILDRAYVLPIGIVAPPRYQVSYKKNKPKIFGRDEKYLCPYFDREGLNCGLWKYRGSVCTSFYCQSSYGRAGKSFWSLNGDYQSYIEMALMEEVLVQNGFSPRQISEQLEYINRDYATPGELKSSRLPLSRFKYFWQDRSEPIEDFFIHCFHSVEKIDKTEFHESLGELGRSLESRLKDSAKKLVPQTESVL